MSRVGKKPIEIPSNVTVSLSGNKVDVKGPKGSLSYTVQDGIVVAQEGAALTVTRANEEKETRSSHGLSRVMIQNMITGVTQGFEKSLTVLGVGYRFSIQGKTIQWNLGFSHPIETPVPEGLEAVAHEKEKNILIIKGIDKQLVGQFAANLRALRKPEPYKGKGVRYSDEYVRRKAGKAAKK